MSTTPNGTLAIVAARLDKLEAVLFTEIHIWTQRFDAREAAITILVNGFDERLGDLENQVAELRDKLK